MQYSDIKTTADYCAYVKDTAETIVESAVEQLKQASEDVENAPPIDEEGIEGCIAYHGLDTEMIDGDAIVIYYFGHNIILEHTDNENYGAENIGFDATQPDTWLSTKAWWAFWAFYGDVKEALSEAITKAAYPEDTNASQKELIAAEWERLDPLKRSYEEAE